MSKPSPVKLAEVELPALMNLFSGAINHCLTLCAVFFVADLTAVGVAVQVRSAGFISLASPLLLGVPFVFIFFSRFFGALLKTGMQLESVLSGTEQDGLMIEIYRTHFLAGRSYLNTVDPSGAGPISRLSERRFSPMPNALITVVAPLALFLIQALTGLGLSRLEGWTMF